MINKITKPLTQRLLAVKTELARMGISKNKQAPQAMGQFKFRGVDATMNLISKLHAENGVLIRVKGIFNKNSETSGKMVRTEADILYEFYSSDNKLDCIESWGCGEGKDSGDKVAGKLHSYAYKNMMFTFYEIPTQSQEVESYDPRIDNEDEDTSGSGEQDKPTSKGGDDNSDAPLKSNTKSSGSSSKKSGKKEEPELQSDPVQGDGDTSQYQTPMNQEEGEQRMKDISKLILELHDPEKVSSLVNEARWLKKEHGINGGAFELVRKNAKLVFVRNQKKPTPETADQE